MRRTLIEEPISHQKPIYGMINLKEGPYYDPYDIHIHNWIRGSLKYPQNHREPLYDRTTVNIKSNDLIEKEYCSVCHELNPDNTNKKPSVKSIDRNYLLQNLNMGTRENDPLITNSYDPLITNFSKEMQLSNTKPQIMTQELNKDLKIFYTPESFTIGETIVVIK